MKSLYRLSKSRRILKHGYDIYKRKGGTLSEHERLSFEHDLEKLDQALLRKDRVEADRAAHGVENFLKVRFPKTPFDHAKEFIFAVVFAIVVAFLIRQLWFELYEVPTGSMRPTIEELDRLV